LLFFNALHSHRTGHQFQEIFINSENLRGRRPVTGQIARKDPQKQNKQNVMKFKLNHLSNFKCRNKKASSLEKDDAFIGTGRR